MKSLYFFFILVFLASFVFAVPDTTPPVTTFVSNVIPGTSDNNITLTCTDNNTGCYSLNYSIDGNTLVTVVGGGAPFDGFEDGDYTTNPVWSLGGGGTATVQSAVKKIGNYAVALTINPDAYLTTPKTTYFDKNYGTWMRTTNTTERTEMTLEKDPVGVTIAYISLYQGKFQYYDGSWHDVGCTASANTWYYGKIIYTDNAATARYEVYDENLVLRCGLVGNVRSAGVVGNIRLYGDGGAGRTSYFDNISKNQGTDLNGYNFIYSGVSSFHTLQYYSIDANNNTEGTNTSQFPQFVNTKDQSYIYLYGATTYNDYNVTDWNWVVNGVHSSDAQNYSYPTSSNTDYNVCLQTGNGTTTDTTCQTITSWDTITPTITVTIDTNIGVGSNRRIDYTFNCKDNVSPINYQVIRNDTNYLYNADDANNTTKVNTVITPLGQSTKLTFKCIDDSNNIASYSTNTYYSLFFRLINEDTGVKYSNADINANFKQITAYTIDGNYRADFNAPLSSDANIWSQSALIVFEIDYKDTAQTQITRLIDFSLLSDYNIPVCVPTLQSFFLQRFVSNTQRDIILKNNIVGCYVLASSLEYAFDTGYSANIYTIQKPYYLYSIEDGVESVLALIDGSQATQYNLDTILFSRQTVNYVQGQDQLAFVPLFNSTTGAYDLSTLQIYYESFYGDNQSLSMLITLDNNTFFDYTASTPNEFVANWYWGYYSGITDQNWFTVTVTIVKTDGTSEVLTYYVNPSGNYQKGTPLNNTWAVILSFILFIFAITLVSIDRVFGLFGILITIVCVALVALAQITWWTILIQVMYIIILLWFFFMGKPKSGGVA